MLHGNEEKVMKVPGIYSGGSSCWKTFAASVRMKNPGSRVRHLHWLQILLVVLLTGDTSCNSTSTAPFSPLTLSTAATPTYAYYTLDVTVDVSGQKKEESEIQTWLDQVFTNNLESCVSLSHTATTTVSTRTTSTSTSNETTPTTTEATSQNNTTTTASTQTTSKSTSNETTPTTTAAASQNNTTTTVSTQTTSTSRSNETTPTMTAAASQNNTTTASTQTTSTSRSNETAHTTTAVTSQNYTTAAPTQTTSKSTSNEATPTTTEATSQSYTVTTATASNTLKSTNKATTTQSTTADPTLSSNLTTSSTIITRKPNPSNKNKERVARQISNRLTAARLRRSTGLFQGSEVSCSKKTAIKNTKCIVTLRLSQAVSPCCILSTLCAASRRSPDVRVVGKIADRISLIPNSCNPLEKNRCIYNGPGSASCEESGAAYVEDQGNLTNCQPKKNCSCSTYCSKIDAYYTFQISIQSPEVDFPYVLSKVSNIKEAPICSPATEFQCPFSTFLLEYKDVNVFCESTGAILQSCKVIVNLAYEVPICNVSAAVTNLFQFNEKISFNGLVTQAAICGNSNASDNPQFTWEKSNLTPHMFCTTAEEPLTFSCQDGKNVVVELDNQCVHMPSTTVGPNVTTVQPNTTTTVNGTSSPLNTTAEPLNTTTIAANVTVTTTLNATTTAANVTVTTTLNATTTPANVTTTESAESQADALLEMTRDVSRLNSSQVDQLVSQLEDLLSGPTISLALGNTSVHIVSNLLGASAETLADSSRRIIGIIDTVGLKLVLNDQAESLLASAVALSVKPADGSNFEETFFSISDPTNVLVRGDPRPKRSVRADSSIPQGSIRLPPTLTQDLTTEQQQLASRLQFNFYQKSTVFQDKSLGEQRKLNSGILGASVANLSITGLKDDVVIRLRNKEPIPKDFKAMCVFWDFTFNNGSGGWNPDNCSVLNSTDNMTTCGCNHLTSFAILLDLSRQPVTDALQATILTFITYIGCGISAIFLSITLLTYLAFGKLRKDIPSKILIQLCLALLLLNLVFLVDAWLALYPDALGLCISTAWFLHYFLLVSFTWMGLEAVHMYLALVKVFNNYVSHYMLRFSFAGWGIPMIVVIIVIAIDKDNYGLVSYGKFSDGTTDGFCWLKNDIAFYVAVVAYFCVIFLFNAIMFVVVLVQLCRIKRQNPHNAQHRTTLQDVRSVLGITILLGLTWGFAFFAWGPVNLAFMYLFAIFNSLQGFFIFVLHCAVKENVRRQWRIYLCCGKMRLAENSEWSRTATQKNTKKSSVTRLTSLNSSQSSQSNNSSSSSSFLATSEQTRGIGSPLEDRAITADEEPGMDVVLNEINRQYRTQNAS
ncbi:adhesion G-protein coupled receptor G2 isoform X2 [Paralichthys olivaceus]|uniref:adhesion G-protein coupled receptor G2 isoform X2 n=1 Tax=Paralichthys olivaceus TaxID=8255 RepID=UPI003750E951